ncbi:DUF2147 domain-containing protein [Mucilaginibacter sp. KACC 22773]|uniref:DUF2147 domain-containing protein n=1 Tax=Mucilaginibacter sp. KACC 22773 TaxID=3025671 RepID=UPI0023655DBB|nr:DUF2147 domain-containing protein [Mucilaginibacter sp. KACC 22773]WDF77100.1 DUF2147 domain-containing protein [Mucilaginibacter sp. KACC 22773]
MKNLNILTRAFTAISLILLTSCTMGQTQNSKPTESDADKIIGAWRSAARDSEMEIYKSGNLYYAKMLAGWGNDMYESDGKTLAKDNKNPDAKLRNRPLLNLVFITDINYKNGAYTGGKLYLAKDGEMLKCDMKFEGEKLTMKWYSDNQLFGPTKKIWSRIK